MNLEFGEMKQECGVMKNKIFFTSILFTCLVFSTQHSGAWSLHEDKSEKTTLAGSDVIGIEDSADNWKIKWTTPARIKTYIENNATPVTSEQIGALFPGPSDGFLLKNGTATSAGAGLTFLTADPASPEDDTYWYNTTSKELKIATADGLWTDGTFAAWSPVSAFQFTNLTDQTADGLLKCSAAITPTGANHSWPVTVTGDTGCSVKIGGGTAAATGTWAPTQTVEACVNASSSASTTTSCILTIGGVVSTQAFTVTTAAAASFCSAHAGAVFCDDFSDGNITGWTNARGGLIAYEAKGGYGAIKITSSVDGVTPADARITSTLPSGTLNWSVSMYRPCTGGFTNNLRMQGGESSTMIFIETKPVACDTWETFSGTITGGVGGSYVRLLDRTNTTAKNIYVKDIAIWQ